MPSVIGVGFRRVADGVVTGERWRLLSDLEAEALPDLLPDWDYNFDLVLTRHMRISPATARHQCLLPPEAPIDLVAVWRSAGTSLRGGLAKVRLPFDEGEHLILLDGVIPGRELAGSVAIKTQLVLAAPATERHPLAAALPGSILWEDEASVLIEGYASRFPIEVVDFQSTLWAPAGAAWHLFWSGHDLYQPVTAGLRLFINARRERVVAAVVGRAADQEATAIRSAIYFDVGRALVRGALSSETFLADAGNFPSGTVGAALTRLIEVLFPGERRCALRSTMDERSDYFDSMLQEVLRVFRDQR